jgi:hypothetical protein
MYKLPGRSSTHFRKTLLVNDDLSGWIRSLARRAGGLVMNSKWSGAVGKAQVRFRPAGRE